MFYPTCSKICPTEHRDSQNYFFFIKESLLYGTPQIYKIYWASKEHLIAKCSTDNTKGAWLQDVLWSSRIIIASHKTETLKWLALVDQHNFMQKYRVGTGQRTYSTLIDWHICYEIWDCSIRLATIPVRMVSMSPVVIRRKKMIALTTQHPLVSLGVGNHLNLSSMVHGVLIDCFGSIKMSY